MPVLTKAKFRPNPKYRIKVNQALDRDAEKLQKALLAPPPKPPRPTPVLSILAGVIAVLVAFAALSIQPPESSEVDQPLKLKMSYSLERT